MTTTVLLAGGTGMLGNRVAAYLLDQSDVAVRLLLRPAGLRMRHARRRWRRWSPRGRR